MQKTGPKLLSRNRVRKLGGFSFTGEFVHCRRYEGDIICFSERSVGLTYYARNLFDPEWIKEITTPKKPGYCPEQPEQLKFLHETIRNYESLPERYKKMVLTAFPVIFQFVVPSLEAFGKFHLSYQSPPEHQFLHEISLHPFVKSMCIPKQAPNLDELIEMSGIDIKSVNLTVLEGLTPIGSVQA